MRLKRALGAVAAVAAVVALSACTHEVAGHPQPDPALANEGKYLKALRGEGIHVTDLESALKTGYDICKDLDAGASSGDLVGGAMQAGLDGGKAGFVIGAAIGAFCPHNTDKVGP